jgi:Spy/CpxP family protein refolding chaperone
MKLLLLAFVTLLPCLALAQSDSTTPPSGPPPGAGAPHMPRDPAETLGRMTKALDLTADQQAKLKPIIQDNYDKAMAVVNNKSLSDADRGEQLKALHKDLHTQIATVLTPDQQAKMKQMHHHGGPGGPGGGDQGAAPSQ